MATEEALLAAAKEGSTSAFTALVEVHQARVRGYLARWIGDQATVDDLAQDVFLTAFRQLARFDGSVPIGAWFAGIARNLALHQLRSERRQAAHRRDALADDLRAWRIAAAEADGERIRARLYEVEALRHCLDELPGPQRELIQAHYLDGRSLVDLARAQAKEHGALRMLMLRVRQRLRTCLERQSGETVPA